MVAPNGARYDTLIKGGRVIDPDSDLVGDLDVAISNGKIATVEANVPPDSAKTVVDASGTFVTPGLVDLHTHIYWGATYWGIEPDPVAARSGVTTWLDVGSAGAFSFPGFRRYVAEASKSRVFSLLNVSSIGLIAPTYELANLDYCDVELAAQIVEENRDLIIGIKARIDAFTTRGTGIQPLALARGLADRVQLPLMVHIGTAPPTLNEICDYLRPGDILTHCFTGQANKVVDENGLVNANIKDLHDRGLILDIGHGAGSFSFETAERMLDQGILPDVISTDIHQLAIQGPMFDMPTTLSKFLLMGMTIEQVIARATSAPSAAMRKPEFGSLKPGSKADVALFALEEGDFTFQDIHMNERKGTRRLVNTLTMIDGEALPQLEERPLHLWAVLPEHQRAKLIPLTAVGV
ncbi:MAG: amidohydrolase/deacetylase family metallohydrolase [Thermomicrobiales bacterium]